MIDIVDIKSAVKNNEIEFFIKDNDIYCKDKQSKEIVKVSVEQTEKKIECPRCNGSGEEPYAWRDPRMMSCIQCNGKDYITE